MGVTPFSLLNPNEPRVDSETQTTRINECKKCDSLIQTVKTCKECGCIMPLKVKLENAFCPLGKW